MNNEQWEKISRAKTILKLTDRATLAEIKKAYRALARQNHPDTVKPAEAGVADHVAMQEINNAYQTLLTYCASYRYPLIRDNDAIQDENDWWMKRFGQDPLWGKGSE